MTSNNKNYQHIVLKVLEAKPVAFNPVLARITGSVKAGLFLSQLLYWWGKEKNDGWIYKTIDEFDEETALSRYEQDEAIKKLKRLKIIEVEIRGIPARRHFKINMENLISLLTT